MFTNPVGEPLPLDGFTKKAKRIIIDATGKPMSPHALRHSAATALADAGVPVHVAQAILGHSGEAMTRFYQHADRDKVEAGMATLDVHLRAV